MARLMLAGRILLTIIVAATLTACSSGGVAEAPVYLTTPQGTKVAALAMLSAREDAAAIRLRDGRVLICGGNTTGTVGGVTPSAELFDPKARTFSATGSMTAAREGATITMLPDGRVLVAGGAQNVGFRSELASAEIYDPSSGTFSATGSMSIPREGHTATALRDGRVLIVGGSDNGTHTLDSAEIYDPAIGTFQRVGHLNQPREVHTATLLLSGKVLVAGGGRGGMPGGYIAYDTAEIFDPASGRFAKVLARMKSDRVGAVAQLLGDGRVLLAGGKSGKIMTARLGTIASFAPLKSAEIYDPESGTFIPTGSMQAAHYLATATTLDNGQVLVVGGWLIQGPTISGMRDAEVYQPELSSFSHTRTAVGRLENTATLLDDGEVLLAGGIDANSLVTSAVEFYSPRQHRFLMVPEPAPGPPSNP